MNLQIFFTLPTKFRVGSKKIKKTFVESFENFANEVIKAKKRVYFTDRALVKRINEAFFGKIFNYSKT